MNMCFLKLGLTLVLCCLIRAILPDSDTQISPTSEFHFVEEVDIPLAEPNLLSFYEKGSFRSILVTSKTLNMGCVYVLNSTIKDHLTPTLFNGNFSIARDVRAVPDGVFDFPAVTIPDGNAKRNLRGRITVANVTDLMNPQLYSLTIDSNNSPSYEYYQPVWMNMEEFLVSRSFYDGDDGYDLLLFKSPDENKTEPWTEIVLNKFNVTQMVLFKNIWKSYDALFAIGILDSLCLFWLEAGDDEVKDWTNLDQLEMRMFEDDFYAKDIQLIDANKDGKLDLLVSQDGDYGESDDEEEWIGCITAFEVPQSEDFKNPSKYISHDLVEMESNQLQPNVLRTFLPTASYEGKPWLLVSGGVFGTAYYVVPSSEAIRDWDYRGHPLVEGEGQVGGVEAADIDGDGMTDLFVSLTDQDLIRVFSVERNLPSSSQGLPSSSDYVSRKSECPPVEVKTPVRNDSIDSTVVPTSSFRSALRPKYAFMSVLLGFSFLCNSLVSS